MDRIQFLKSLGLGLVSLNTLDFSYEFQKGKSMALQLYSVRDFVAKDLEGTLEKLATIGYREIELYGYDGTFFGKTPKEFKAILKNTGVKVISSHHVSGIASKAPGSLSNGWDKAVEDLDFLGAKFMACSYLFPNERTKEIYTSLPDLLSKSGAKAKQAGIQFAYHNHDFEFEPFNDTLFYDHLLKNTSADQVQMELDLYWISRAGFDPIQYFEKYPGRFPLWHVKDMEAGTKDITEVGHGTIDFDKIFAHRNQAGLKKWFVEQDVSKGDMFKSITSSYDFLCKKKIR